MALVHRSTGKQYDGDSPYVMLSVDGRDRPEPKDSPPKVASAATLQQLLGPKSKPGAVVQALEDAMQLSNDAKFRDKADSLKKQRADLDPSSEAYKAAKTLYDAYVKNIREDALKPTSRVASGPWAMS